MLTKLYFIEKQLAICPKPSGKEGLIEEVAHWASAGVNVVVCLLTKAEIKELGLENEQTECEKQGIDFVHFPIQDRQVPESYLQSKALINNLFERLAREQKIIIHCRGGIGRATIIAGSLLIQKGLTTSEVLDKISKVRTMKVPDTEEQVRWLREFEGRVKENK